jgi:hypothetical protein
MIKPGARLTAMHAMEHHGGEGAHHGAEHAATELPGHTEAAMHAMPFEMGFTIPGLLELGTMLGFLALFIYVILNQLSKSPLTPKNDPYLEESMHHHVELHGEEAH